MSTHSTCPAAGRLRSGSLLCSLLVGWTIPALLAGQSKETALQAAAQSSVKYTQSADGPTVEIHNVTYEVAGGAITGRPPNERLLLRKTIHSKSAIEEPGVEASVTLEAWPLGMDLKQKPLYTISESGTEGHSVSADLFVVDRQLEEVEWWSVHKLGNGQRLFDTYVPLVSFSISREVLTTRYVGLEVPPDDVTDARLKDPHVVAVLSYASPERVVREALLTCDDPKQAQLLRSYADSTRTLVEIEAAGRRSLKLSISQNYPSPPGAMEALIPIAKDDLDLAHAHLAAGLHLAAWKR